MSERGATRRLGEPVRTFDGRVARSRALSWLVLLGLAAEITARSVPRHLAAVETGDAVRFGPFTVDLDGVEKEGERLPWPLVRDVVIDNGLVTVRPRGGRAPLAAVAGQMPDALAFTALCGQVGRLNGDDA